MSGSQPIIIKKKKVSGHGGHHGGSWKVAYADFVTAMMAFFMVMWIMGMSAETRKSIQSYFNDPVAFNKNPPTSHSILPISATAAGKKSSSPGDKDYDHEQKALERAEQKIKAELSKAQGVGGLDKDVKVTLTPDGLQIELVETRGAVFFESGSAVVRPQARAIIARLAPILARTGKPMEVQGHTDAAPFAGAGGNFGLSSSRALSLMEELRADGCKESQFHQVVGYGATRLEKPEAPLDFSNRRVTILIPREAGTGDAPPAARLKDRLREGNEPQAVDLRPEGVDVRGMGEHKVDLAGK